MLRRHDSSLESLPQDLVELILERLPVVPLHRFKSVSKKWKRTIESRRFQQRQFIRRRQSRGPDLLFMRLNGDDSLPYRPLPTTIVFRSSLAWTVTFPMTGTMFCHGSCDGLVCIYCIHTPSVVVNPATKWHRSVPLSTSQHLLIQTYNREESDFPCPKLGFGKDTLSGTYKPVFLYNSSEFGLGNATTCELFDFGTNAWRYVVPASPYRIIAYHSPVYLDGSLYWFTECEEPKVLSFHLHTETFQVICKAPFAHPCDPRSLTMCILHNRLCVSEKKWPTQVIWSFDGSKTWNQMCSIDLTETFSWFGEPVFPLSPIAILYKDQLLLQGRDSLDPVVLHDLHTKSYRLLFKPTRCVASVYYFQSLFSASSN